MDVSSVDDSRTTESSKINRVDKATPTVQVDSERALTSRPQRWDEPFGKDMNSEVVDTLMNLKPFADMDEGRFTQGCPLRKLLLNDTRLMAYEAGDVVVREGDYGNSAFLILSGSVQVALDSLPQNVLGAPEAKRKTFWQAASQLWTNSRHRESRKIARISGDSQEVGLRQTEGDTRIFLQDVPGVLSKHRTLKLTQGEVFGELAALSRTPRTATVFADGKSLLLEIRWQGLRELMRRDPALKKHIHDLYRQNSLESHLRETPFLRQLSAEDIRRIADQTEFESYGDFEWHRGFAKSESLSVNEKILKEPVISEEGHYTNGVLLIRSGFARLSHRWGGGHRTISYLGKGQAFGLAELAYAHRTGNRVPLQFSLRAQGHVDALFIPTSLVEELVLPTIDAEEIDRLSKEVEHCLTARASGAQTSSTLSDVDPGMMEFIADHRLMNGTATMMIDLDRCIRCDDCVRACATAHDNNPRFTREGPRYGRYQFPHACMHCVDPVCLIGCPTGAIGREPSSGNVLINDLTCVGLPNLRG